MKCVAMIPLRGGSKSIPMKNIKMLGGKPLAFWVLEEALKAPSIDLVYVSTDSFAISDVIQSSGLNVHLIDRPSEFSTDEASTESVMLHFMNSIDFDILVTIQATSPMLLSVDLERAILKFKENKYDSMLSAVRTKRFFWSDDVKPINYDPLIRPRRQDFSGTLMENGAFYITKRKILETTHCRLGGDIGIYEMDANSALEIDEPEDWGRIERILLSQRSKYCG